MMGKIRSLYNETVRSRLPRKLGTYAGVAVRRPRLLDRRTDVPEFKESIVEGLRDCVRPGETVVDIGAGWGVVTTRAARLVGPQGRVHAYEASPDRLEMVRDTVERNHVDDRVRIVKAAVGTVTVDRGGAIETREVSVEALPSHDVATVDIEGAESEVLPALVEWGEPRTVIVETHERHGTDWNELVEACDRAGYEVVDRGKVTPNTDSEGHRVLQANRIESDQTES